MSALNYKFEGWLGLDKSAAEGNMVWQEFEPKEWEDTDIDIKVTNSGICGTDLHTLRSGWYPAPYPICVGHEIVGIAVHVRRKAIGDIKVGDRVGIGAQANACLGRFGRCKACDGGKESYCKKPVHTYGAFHYNGGKAMGGYATHHRCPSYFVFKIDDRLDSASVAPMLCGGITVYSPLKLHGCGPGKTVGVIGIGGLGHCGILFAKALGADRVVGISRSESKRDEVLKMGADDYIATAERLDWATEYTGVFDIIINTIGTSKVPFNQYLSLVSLDGTFIQVGLPEDGSFEVNAFMLVSQQIKLTGSNTGSRQEIREMLNLAADKGIKLWVQERPMTEANQGIVDFEAGKARYRYVLTL
ncbi:cinnamyl alcohol dehydrogenase [Colletotrichum fioriniae PJ7]|uniref:alcohol dehydrogenase (NADP(+)) n=1 Tax=Colletotrichum fioriniae PJ7 TaxID=1445577 RepID=A0A010RZC8_9PEZI|nr:cinnamyl alcohol dehydrogenase [Colletotrichum fioriniae PJ7]